MKLLQTLVVVACASLALPVSAAPLLTGEQYIDYQAEAKCIDQQYWDDPEQQETRRNALDKRFGITDANLEQFDALAMAFDADAAVLEAIELKMAEACPQTAE